MKKVFLALFLSFKCFASSWIVDTDIPKANAQDPSAVLHAMQSFCLIENPGHICYDATGENLRYRKIVGGAWVDDATLKAAYDAEQAELASYLSVTVAFMRASGGGTDSCTTSPCSIDRNYPVPEKVESVTRNSVGNYTVNFVSGVWSVAPLCAAANDKGNGDFCVLSGMPTTSAASVLCYSGALVLTDTDPILICGGK
jgi:hypothetical protein